MKINILRYILVPVSEVPGGVEPKSSGPVAYEWAECTPEEKSSVISSASAAYHAPVKETGILGSYACEGKPPLILFGLSQCMCRLLLNLNISDNSL